MSRKERKNRTTRDPAPGDNALRRRATRRPGPGIVAKLGGPDRESAERIAYYLNAANRSVAYARTRPER